MASVLYLLYTPAHWEHLVIWLTTIGGAVLLKTIYAVVVGRDVRLLLFPFNQLMVREIVQQLKKNANLSR